MEESSENTEDEITLTAANPLADLAGSTVFASTDMHPQPQVKRGPGRPRKEPAGDMSVVSKEEAGASKESAVAPMKVGPGLPESRKIEMVALVDLEPDLVNSTVYTASSALAEQALVGSMKVYGILTPLLGYRRENGKVCIRSGHRRAKAAEAAGLTHVPMELVEPPAGDKDTELPIHANIQRDKTNEEKIREFLALRKGAFRTRQGTAESGRQEITLWKMLHKLRKERADDIAAKQVGLSRPTARKGAEVVEVIDRLTAEGKQDEADKLRQVLNGQSFDAAIQAAAKAGYIESPPPKKPSATAKPEQVETKNGALPAGTGFDAAGKEKVSAPASNNDADQSPDELGDAPEGNNTGDGNETANAKLDPTGAAGGDLPSIVALTEAINRFVDDQEDFDAGDVSNDQKWNFNHAFKSLSDWHTDHAEMLRLPGQPLS